MLKLSIFYLCAVIICNFLQINGKNDANLPKPSQPDDAPPKNPLSRGWNDEIAWVTLDQGLKLAKEQRKPVFVLIHKTWCHACQNLKKTFAKAKLIQDLSKNFVMVNCEDDEEPWEEEYAPNGDKYIPRLFFVDPDGTVLKDVKNPKVEFDQYPYYYSNPAPIITVMKQVMKKYNLSETSSDSSTDSSSNQLKKEGKKENIEKKAKIIDDGDEKAATKKKKDATKTEL